MDLSAIRAKILLQNKSLFIQIRLDSTRFHRQSKGARERKMSDDGDSFQLDDNDDAEPITAQKVRF